MSPSFYSQSHFKIPSLPTFAQCFVSLGLLENVVPIGTTMGTIFQTFVCDTHWFYFSDPKLPALDK